MSTWIKHTPSTYYERCYLIEGDNLDELIVECVNRIRQRSKEFYSVELRADLVKERKSLIDVHAGMGNSYTVKLLT